MAFLTYLIPAGTYELDENGQPIPGTYHQVESTPQRIVVDSLMAPINGLYGIESSEDGSISVWNSGELFGAIDVALFILVIGGFLGVTMKTGAIQGGIARIVTRLKGRERWMIPILMAVFALGGTTYGMAEESLAFYALVITVMIAAGYDARRGRLDPPARLRDRGARLHDQPVRHRHRVRLRGDVDQRGPDRPARDPDRRHDHRDRVCASLRRPREGRPEPVAWCSP